MPPSGFVLGREVDREKMPNTAGVGQIENPILGSRPYYVPMVGSDGLDEIAAAGAAIGYQKQVDWKQQLSDDLGIIEEAEAIAPEDVEWIDALTPRYKAGRNPKLDSPEYKAAKRRVHDKTSVGPFATGVWRRAWPIWNYDMKGWQ